MDSFEDPRSQTQQSNNSPTQHFQEAFESPLQAQAVDNSEHNFITSSPEPLEENIDLGWVDLAASPNHTSHTNLHWGPLKELAIDIFRGGNDTPITQSGELADELYPAPDTNFTPDGAMAANSSAARTFAPDAFQGHGTVPALTEAATTSIPQHSLHHRPSLQVHIDMGQFQCGTTQAKRNFHRAQTGDKVIKRRWEGDEQESSLTSGTKNGPDAARNGRDWETRSNVSPLEADDTIIPHKRRRTEAWGFDYAEACVASLEYRTGSADQAHRTAYSF